MATEMREQLDRIKAASPFNKAAEVERLAGMLIGRVEALEAMAADIAAIRDGVRAKAAPGGAARKKGAANG